MQCGIDSTVYTPLKDAIGGRTHVIIGNDTTVRPWFSKQTIVLNPLFGTATMTFGRAWLLLIFNS